MRIVHVVSTFPPYRGGMGNVAREIAERTAVRGHEVIVVTPKRVENGEWIVDSDRDRQLSTINYQLSTPRPWARFGNAAWCPSITRALEQIHPDFVHLHWPFIGGVASVLAWRRRNPQRRLVVQYHMDLVATGWRGVVFRLYQWWTLPRLLRRADRVVVSSLDYAHHGALAPYVHRLGDRLVEIPFGVDTERFAPERNQDGTSHIPHPKSQILFVGGLDRAHAFKGVSVLLNAIARVPDARLRIVGDGDCRRSYARQARVLGIADRVEFLGSVPDAELPDVYRSSDVLVLPSVARSEAFGIVLLEAMASGVPVIASDLPGVRTVIVEGETGFLVPPGDADALAHCIAEFVRDPDHVRRMGVAARERVETRYHWERIIDRWATEYDRVCAA